MEHVLVSGGASGIGAACVRALAEDGQRVSIFDRDLVGADALAAELTTVRYAVAAFSGDTASEGDVARAFSGAEVALGPLTGVVISAGITLHASIEESDVGDWDRVVAVNLRGPFLMIREALPRLRANGGGSIVAVASVDGVAAEPGASAYCASKAGLLGLVRVAALEGAKANVRINAVCPSTTDTPMLRKHLSTDSQPHTLASLRARHPIPRLIEPHEVASPVRFLLSTQASAITGTTLVVDLGLLAGWTFPPNTRKEHAGASMPTLSLRAL